MRKFVGIALVFGMASAMAAAAKPQIGAAAPPLHFNELWQAPAGAKVDWPAFRGKVVVLEFWATWCGPCVASIPHLNELAAAVDPAKVQFISVDDEDPKVVRNFLSKRKIAGWIGIDTSGAMFKQYGIGGRPTTVVVNTQGHIVTFTQPQLLNAKDLQALAVGKKVSFTSFEMPAPNGVTDGSRTVLTAKSSSDPVFLLELTKVPPGTKGGGIFGPGGKFVMFATKPKGLISFAFDVPEDRILAKAPLPNDLYRFRGAFGDAPDSATRPLLEAAVTTGLNIRVVRKDAMKETYVLRATPESHKLLVPSIPHTGKLQGYWGGKVHIVGGSLDEFAREVEQALQEPVVNETKITGEYDAELAIPEGNTAAARTALAKVMGLDLIEEERSISVIEVDALPASEAKAAH